MTQEQNTIGGKNDKRTKNNPSPSHYMLNPMLLLLKLILWHKYEREIVSNETESS